MEIADLVTYGLTITLAVLVGVGLNHAFKRRKAAKNAKNKTGIETL